MNDFDPARKTRVNRPLFSSLTLKEEGKTNDPALAWSGNTLMDLTRYQALRMVPVNLGGKDYLFVEAGGFGTRKKPGWKPKLLVLAR